MKVSHSGNRDNLHSFLVELRRVELDFTGDDNDAGLLATVWIKAQGADTTRDNQADVAVAKIIVPTGIYHGGHQIAMRHRDRQQDCLGRAKQAVDVLL